MRFPGISSCENEVDQNVLSYGRLAFNVALKVDCRIVGIAFRGYPRRKPADVLDELWEISLD